MPLNSGLTLVLYRDAHSGRRGPGALRWLRRTFCDGSTFLLSSLDLPVVSQIVEASEELPLLSMLLKLDMEWCIRRSGYRYREDAGGPAEAVFSSAGSA